MMDKYVDAFLEYLLRKPFWKWVVVILVFLAVGQKVFDISQPYVKGTYKIIRYFIKPTPSDAEIFPYRHAFMSGIHYRETFYSISFDEPTSIKGQIYLSHANGLLGNFEALDFHGGEMISPNRVNVMDFKERLLLLWEIRGRYEALLEKKGLVYRHLFDFGFYYMQFLNALGDDKPSLQTTNELFMKVNAIWSMIKKEFDYKVPHLFIEDLREINDSNRNKVIEDSVETFKTIKKYFKVEK